MIAVPIANKQKFIEHARQLDPIFLTLGAIRVIEGWGDDVPEGKVTDFRRAVQATAEETVAFSWVEWPDKTTRDAAMKKMMDDPRMDPSASGNPPMPFDGKRMIFGGFEQVGRSEGLSAGATPPLYFPRVTAEIWRNVSVQGRKPRNLMQGALRGLAKAAYRTCTVAVAGSRNLAWLHTAAISCHTP